MKMNLRPQQQQQQQQPTDDRQHGADTDAAIPKSSASESSTKAQYGDAHEHVSRRARSSSSAHQHRRSSSLTAAALEAHSSSEQGGSRRRESPDDTLAQVGVRTLVRPRRPRRRSTGMAPLRIRDEAVPEQALRGDGAAALESKLKNVHFNPLTTEFGDPAGPTYGITRPPAPAKSRMPRVFVERMLDEFGDLQAWYR